MLFTIILTFFFFFFRKISISIRSICVPFVLFFFRQILVSFIILFWKPSFLENKWFFCHNVLLKFLYLRVGIKKKMLFRENSFHNNFRFKTSQTILWNFVLSLLNLIIWKLSYFRGKKTICEKWKFYKFLVHGIKKLICDSQITKL